MLKIQTKLNKNGNSYKLLIDTDNKTYKKGYNAYWGKGDITTTKKDIYKHIDFLKMSGFEEAGE